MRIILFLFSLIFLIGCVGSPIWYRMKMSETIQEAKINNEKIMGLQIGQPRYKVLEIMGSPTKREVYKIENGIIEFLFYRTQGWGRYDSQDRDEHFTPLAFQDKELIGWGRNFYDRTIRQSLEVIIK